MEWKLNRTIFNIIMGKHGNCTVDLFASSLNHQIVPYVYFPDENAMAINAFSLNWAQHFSYISPPFSCYGAILQKLEEEEAVVVAPLFTTQPWFLHLLQLTTAPPLILPRSGNLLMQPNTNKSHSLKKMSLGVFRVSGKKCVTRAFQVTLPTLSYLHGDKARKSNMGLISRSGCDFVVNRRLLHMNHM